VEILKMKQEQTHARCTLLAKMLLVAATCLPMNHPSLHGPQGFLKAPPHCLSLD